MDSWKLVSGLVLLALIGWIVAIAVTLGTEVLASGDWQVTGAVSLVATIVFIGLYIAIGTPWNRWERTAYW